MSNTISKLQKIRAFSVNSADNERQSSNKGIYNSFETASKYTKNAGWYGSNGEVVQLPNIYADEEGTLYTVKEIGDFTDVKEVKEKELLESIQSKLTPEELEFAKKVLK